MKLIIKQDYFKLSKFAADEIKCLLKKNPSAVLGLPTGGTPKGMYKHLINLYESGEIDFSHASAFNLDEYIGLHPNHPQSYHYYMQEHLYNKVNFAPESIHIPNGGAQDLEIECVEYETKIEQAGEIDLLILGIGLNGHIGFNEPGSNRSNITRVVELDASTITANSRYFDREEDVPKKAITMGIKTMLKSKKILLIAHGKEKADIVYKFLQDEPTSNIPATYLKDHPNVSLLLDSEAASKIEVLNLDTYQNESLHYSSQCPS